MGLAIAVLLVEGIMIVAGIAVVIIVFVKIKKRKVIWASTSAIAYIAAVYGPSLVAMALKDSLCTDQAGGQIAKKVNARNYLIINTSSYDFKAYDITTALIDVLDRDYDFVELKVTPKIGKRTVLQHMKFRGMGLNEYSRTGEARGYYTFFKGIKQGEMCVSRRGIKGKAIRSKYYPRLASVLPAENECIGAQYGQQAKSRYVLEMFEKEMFGITKSGIEVTDKKDNAVLGAFTKYKFNLRPIFLLFKNQDELECPSVTPHQILLRNKFHWNILMAENVETNNK